MNLYRLTDRETDSLESAIVVAESEEEARVIAEMEQMDEKTDVELIGTAGVNMKKGIVIANF